MHLILLLFFIAIPLIELAILIAVGSQIGVLATIGIVVATAILGSTILHRQGLTALRQAQEQMTGAKIPIGPAVDGLFLVIAGVCLLTPGLLTDAAGFVLLVPPIRHWLAKRLFDRVMKGGKVDIRTYRSDTTGDAEPVDGPRKPPRPAKRGTVIDGEFERLDEKTVDPRKHDDDKRS